MEELLKSTNLNEYKVSILLGNNISDNIIDLNISLDQFNKLKQKITNMYNVYKYDNVNSIHYHFLDMEMIKIKDNIKYIQHSNYNVFDLTINSIFDTARIKIKNDKNIDPIYFPSIDKYNDIYKMNTDTYLFPNNNQIFNQLFINFITKKYDNQNIYSISLYSHFDDKNISNINKYFNTILNHLKN